jgi:hypothetical protein
MGWSKEGVRESEEMDNLRNRSIGELFSELSRDVSTLVRKEIELARVEMSAIAGTVARRAVLMAAGAALCFAGLMSLIATLTFAGIAMGMSPLVSSLVVTLLVFAIGGLLVMQGMAALKKDHLVPTETIQTLKDTGEIFRTPATGARVAPATSRGM